MIEVNLKNRAASQTTLAFNSMCRFGDVYLGADSSGLHLMRDYNDNNTDIAALIKTGKFDLGTERKKSIRYFYFGIETDGQMTLTLYNDGVEVADYVIPYPGAGRQTVKVKVARGLRARFWEFKLENTDGCFFTLYSVKIFPVVLQSA